MPPFFLIPLLAPLFYGLYRAHRAHQHHDHGEGDGNPFWASDEAQRRRQERKDREAAKQAAKREAEAAALAAKVKRVEKAREGDSRAFDQLLRKAHVLNGEPEECTRIAKAVQPEDIELAIYSGTPQLSDLDLRSKRSEEPSIWPTDDIRPVPISEADQIADVVVEDALLDDDEFFSRFAQDELTVLQSFAEIREQPILAIVLDGSPSMAGDGSNLSNGLERQVLARGVAINLLLRALDGGTRYLFRYFDSRPRSIEVVDTPDEAQRLIERLSDRFEQGSGTDVLWGFMETVANIRSKGGEWTRAEIVLISDCEDNNLKPDALAAAVAGEDIRFHVVAVGISSPSLKAVATTYREFL